MRLKILFFLGSISCLLFTSQANSNLINSCQMLFKEKMSEAQIQNVIHEMHGLLVESYSKEKNKAEVARELFLQKIKELSEHLSAQEIEQRLQSVRNSMSQAENSAAITPVKRFDFQRLSEAKFFLKENNLKDEKEEARFFIKAVNNSHYANGLILAIDKERVDLLEPLLLLGSDPIMRLGYDSKTVHSLEIAIKSKQHGAQMVRILIEHGIKIGDLSERLLEFAVNQSDIKLVELLIQNGAIADTGLKYALTKITSFVDYPEYKKDTLEEDIVIFKTLVEKTSDINKKYYFGGALPTETLLEYLLSGYRYKDKEIPKTISSLVEYLVDKGANMYEVDSNGWPILWSIKPELLEILFQKGLSPNQPIGKYNQTLLYYFSDRESIILILKHSANPNVSDSNGLTPLMHHVHKAADILLDAGANINARDNTHKTALEHALDSYFLGISNHLDTTTAFNAINTLLARGADPKLLTPQMKKLIKEQYKYNIEKYPYLKENLLNKLE